MAAGTYNFAFEQGTTINVPVAYNQRLGGSLVPYDVTGWAARMQIRQTLHASAVLHSFTTENGGIEVDGPAGTFTIKASAAATSAWTFTSGVYDLEIVAPSGAVTRLLRGMVTVSPEVTR